LFDRIIIIIIAITNNKLNQIIMKITQRFPAPNKSLPVFCLKSNKMKTNKDYYLSLLLFWQLCFIACKEVEVKSPVVQIDSITNISHNSVIVFAQVLDDGGSTPTSAGMAWSDKPGVSLADTIIKTGDAYREFSIPITELESGKSYYLRPYCEDFRGKFMGEEISFTTKNAEKYKDPRDGNEYPVLQLGKLIWMAENLRFITQDGSVPVIDAAFGELPKFGRLYTYNAAVSACPDEWRIPTDEDWIDLERFIGIPEAELKNSNRTSTAGNKLKNPGNKYSEYISNYETNSSGFTAFPAGSYDAGKYNGFGTSTFFITSPDSNSVIWLRYFTGTEGILNRLSSSPTASQYYSLRCVKNVP